MREKIARAAFVAMNGYEPSDDAFEGLMAPKSKSGMALAVADAVLGALMEPTQEMRHAIWSRLEKSARVGNLRPGHILGDGHADVLMRDIIRAAKEGE